MTKQFSTSLFTPWIKTKVEVTNEAVTLNIPNRILGGFVALGSQSHQIAVRNISDAVLHTSYNARGIFVGCMLILAGFYFLVGWGGVLVPVLFLGLSALGLLKIFTGIETCLQIQRGGNDFFLSVPFYSKKAVMEVQAAIREVIVYGEQKYDMNVFAQRIIDGIGDRIDNAVGR